MQLNFQGLKLSDEPRVEWLMTRDDLQVPKTTVTGAKVMEPYKYVPIRIVEDLLKHFYPINKIEILGSQILANSVVVTVRVHYYDDTLGQWLFHDGGGAAMIATAPKAGCVDFNYMRPTDVMSGLPAAKSFAIKDACDHLGNIFGGNLNRNDVNFYASLPKPEKEELKAKGKATAKVKADAMVDNMKEQLKIPKK